MSTTPNPAPMMVQPSNLGEDGPRSAIDHPARSRSLLEGDPFMSREGSPGRASRHLTESSGNAAGPTNRHMSPSSVEKLEDMGVQESNRYSGNLGVGAGQPLPPLPPLRIAEPGIRRQLTTDTRISAGRRSGIDWIVPVDEKPTVARTDGERLQPTLDQAVSERDKYATKAKMTGYALNAAIGLQVLLGSLTTGLSAVATTGKSAAVQTTILGALSTIVASYLARARGSNEPELSITRTKDLEQFIRECRAFQMDYGHYIGSEHDEQLSNFRRRFEELLGNANGERRLAPPV